MFERFTMPNVWFYIAVHNTATTIKKKEISSRIGIYEFIKSLALKFQRETREFSSDVVVVVVLCNYSRTD